MSQFVKSIEKRKLNLKSGRYHFNCEVKGEKMIVKEDFTVVMDKIITIPYGEEERKRNIEYNQCLRIIEGMSVDEIKEMLRGLEQSQTFVQRCHGRRC